MAPLRVMLLRLALLAVAAVTVTAAARPSEVAVGALFTYDSTIGRAARLAIELAVDDVNADRTVLAGTHLNLLAQDTNCSGFLGTIEGWPPLCFPSVVFFVAHLSGTSDFECKAD